MHGSIGTVLAPLQGSPDDLTSGYDVALLDLDGVVYVGPDAVPGAPDALVRARADGMQLAFVTNNAARPPNVVADHLTSLGIEATSSEVITSAQAAARYLADRLPGGAHVLVVGTTGLEVALRERGLVPVSDANGPVDAVVQGYSPDLSWGMLAEGAVAINRGVVWVATNVDPTVPSPRGPLPGNGSLVAALTHATGKRPVVTGKPDPTMHRETVIRTGAERPIVVGDRLDTDIEGANAVGCASLLVFSGVTAPADLPSAGAAHRPTYVGRDLSALLEPHPEVVASDDGGHRCGEWTVRGTAGAVMLQHEGSPAAADGDDPTAGSDHDLDALRAICAAVWADAGDEPAEEVAVTGDGSDEATATLQRLGLAD